MSMFLDSGRELEYREERKPHMEKVPKKYKCFLFHMTKVGLRGVVACVCVCVTCRCPWCMELMIALRGPPL